MALLITWIGEFEKDIPREIPELSGEPIELLAGNAPDAKVALGSEGAGTTIEGALPTAANGDLAKCGSFTLLVVSPDGTIKAVVITASCLNAFLDRDDAGAITASHKTVRDLVTWRRRTSAKVSAAHAETGKRPQDRHTGGTFTIDNTGGRIK